MARLTALLPDDRAWVDDLIDGEILTGANVPSQITRDVSEALERIASEGDETAGRCLMSLAQDGLRARVAVRLKDDRSVVRVTRDGSIVSMPSRFGTPVMSPEGVREKHWQQSLWWELTWDQFTQLIRSLERQRATLGREIEALKQVATLRDTYPDTKTVIEACERDGQDPRSFGIELPA